MLKTGTQDLRINPQFGPQHGIGYRQVNIGDRIIWTSTATTADSYVCCVYDISTTGATSIVNVTNGVTMSVDFNTIESATTSYTFTTAGRHVIFFYFGGFIPSNAFYNINRLKEVYVKGMSGIYYQAFKNCTNLISINLNEVPFSDSNALGGNVFEGCTNLQHVGGLPETLVGGENNLTYLFKGCKSLTGCTLPAAFRKIAPAMFYGCENLDMEIPSGVTAVTAEAFRQDMYTQNKPIIRFPSTLNLKSIGSYAFFGSRIWYDEAQSSWYLREGLETIGNSAFESCKEMIFDNLVLDIPSTVTSIGDEAFAGFLADSNAIAGFKGATPPSCGMEIFGNPNYFESTIMVPQGSLVAYQAALPEYASHMVEY